ncbi:MAG: MinD/ParA family ATP-binding protein [Halovenus sp.]
MLAIAGGKGGSGKTTTALGLAAILQDRGREPLVVDCDCDMPDLHHKAGVESIGGIDGLADGTPVELVAAESTTVPGVRILTAGSRENLDRALSRLGVWHGPVVLDSPPGMGPDAARPLRHADRSLLVSTDRHQSVADTRTTARSARKLDAPPVGLLVRETGIQSPSNWPEPDTVRKRVPTVPEPLASPTVRKVWAETAATLFGAHRAVSGA